MHQAEKERIDSGRNFLHLLTATQADYQEHLPIYMLKRSDFISFVMSTWQQYLSSLSQKVDYFFADYDQFHRRGYLNFDQFAKVVQTSLRMSLPACFSPAGIATSPLRLFNEAVVHSGQIVDNRGSSDHQIVNGGQKERLLSLEGVRTLILERNYEVLPFYKLMRSKYGSGSNLHGALQSRIMQKLRHRFTSVLTKSKSLERSNKAQGKTSGSGL